MCSLSTILYTSLCLTIFWLSIMGLFLTVFVLNKPDVDEEREFQRQSWIDKDGVVGDEE